MAKHLIEFRELRIRLEEDPLFSVYYVIDNGMSQVMDGFAGMSDASKYEVKNLITKMLTHEDYQSHKIRWRMQKAYSYGELKPRGHRFFFFLVLENKIVFFRYARKSSKSLGNKFYKGTERQKRIYENEFKRQIQKH